MRNYKAIFYDSHDNELFDRLVIDKSKDRAMEQCRKYVATCRYNDVVKYTVTLIKPEYKQSSIQAQR